MEITVEVVGSLALGLRTTAMDLHHGAEDISAAHNAVAQIPGAELLIAHLIITMNHHEVPRPLLNLKIGLQWLLKIATPQMRLLNIKLRALTLDWRMVIPKARPNPVQSAAPLQRRTKVERLASPSKLKLLQPRLRNLSQI